MNTLPIRGLHSRGEGVRPDDLVDAFLRWDSLKTVKQKTKWQLHKRHQL